MRSPRKVFAIAAVAAVVATGAVGLVASPAEAAVAQYAVAGTPPKFGSGVCVTHSGAEACFEKHGDKIWVLDTSGNGVSADADWENFLRDTTGGWTQYRAGSCINNLTHGNWGVCNMDFYEDTTFNHYGGYGSGLRLDACDGGACSSEIWIRNNA